MKLFIFISIFAILVSSDDEADANKLGREIVESLERAIKESDAAKVNDFYSDDYIIEDCGKAFNKKTFVEALLEPADDEEKAAQVEKKFRIANGKYDGTELKFTEVVDIGNEKSVSMEYVVQKIGDKKPVITYNKLITCVKDQ